MKRIIATFTVFLSVAAAYAQDRNEPLIDRGMIRDTLNIGGILMVMYIITYLILEILQRNLDHRLKSKIIESGTQEGIVSRLLANKKRDNRKVILQWICVLLSIGGGLSIINFAQPFGLHSIAIMAFSLGAGLLAYYLISGRAGKDDL
ncbi:hypothetical protein Q4E93_18480 [Flavitalea sp. BT771]|uniref:hypothetical protein n=1 Tax=Flavitalea sp. BT771 TaxID=3063329 RepID=UPI0026E35EC1|nr:hypothetical protein [Flavitalea sp. BT771]MDO6432599.1 hypothetical protein [Flavitalea sp. BT771]MDV6222125.1 hypothetical protein [Flavitalea sp. BT771]